MSEQEKELTLDDVKRLASNERARDEKSKSRVQLIVFKQGNEEYALRIDQIKEVVLTPGIAKIPRTPEYVVGVANIRGNIIAIIDLEKKFDLKIPENSTQHSQYTLVIESDDYKVGVLVKEVPNTLSVSEGDIDVSQEVLQYSSLSDECINGIVKHQNRMIILVDLIRMMQVEDLHNLIK